MAPDDDQVRMANVVDPIEQKFPQVLNPLIDLAFPFQSDLLDFVVLAPMCIRPTPDGFDAVVRELNRRTRGLADNRP